MTHRHSSYSPAAAGGLSAGGHAAGRASRGLISRRRRRRGRTVALAAQQRLDEHLAVLRVFHAHAHLPHVRRRLLRPAQAQ